MYIYCSRPVTGRHHAIASKNQYTHDVMAGLSLRWAHMGFFCLIDAFVSILMNRALKNRANYLVDGVSPSVFRCTSTGVQRGTEVKWKCRLAS